MKIERFEDVIAWQKGRILILRVYKEFRNCKDYDFRSQIQRAAVSICNNIAEGFERKSEKELVHFLFISKGSCGETRSMLYNALDLSYINQKQFNDLSGLSFEISKILAGLIKSCS
jgi:four helix bundle protein